LLWAVGTALTAWAAPEITWFLALMIVFGAMTVAWLGVAIWRTKKSIAGDTAEEDGEEDSA
jgi:hypothetical protein